MFLMVCNLLHQYHVVVGPKCQAPPATKRCGKGNIFPKNVVTKGFLFVSASNVFVYFSDFGPPCSD